MFQITDAQVSLGFSKAAYEKAVEPKELYLVKSASHVDLHDRTELIPWERLRHA